MQLHIFRAADAVKERIAYTNEQCFGRPQMHCTPLSLRSHARRRPRIAPAPRDAHLAKHVMLVMSRKHWLSIFLMSLVNSSASCHICFFFCFFYTFVCCFWFFILLLFSNVLMLELKTKHQIKIRSLTVAQSAGNSSTPLDFFTFVRLRSASSILV